MATDSTVVAPAAEPNPYTRGWWNTPTKEGFPVRYRPSHPNDVENPCEKQHKVVMDKFGGGYPLPFQDRSYWDSRTQPTVGDYPRTVVELLMCSLSSSIRDKDSWHVKMKDRKIRSKWRDDALMSTPSREEWKLTDTMVRHPE
jgi:hypothetical protein